MSRVPGGPAGLLLAVLALIAVGMHAFVLPPEGWVTGDQGSKFLQTRAFAANGPLDPSIEVASRDVDPEFRYQEPKLKNRRGRLVSEFLWLLPLVSAPFYLLFGLRGLYVVPALSVGAIAIASAVLARHLAGQRGSWLPWLVVLSTPVLVYGLEFWEHAPAVACVMAAAVLAFPPKADDRHNSARLIASGASVALGALLREEVAVALPALVIARALVLADDRLRGLLRTALLPGAGAMAVFAVSVPLNLLFYGSLLPMHVTQDAWEVAKATSYWQVRRDMMFTLLLPAQQVALFITGLVIGVCAAVVQSWRQRQRSSARDDRWSRLLLLAVHASVAILLVPGVAVPVWNMVVLGARGEAYRVTSAAHTWVFALVLLYWPWVRAQLDFRAARFLIASGLLIVAGTFVIVPTDGGSQWSPRFFLAAVPFMAIVAGAALLTPRSSPGVRLAAGYRPAVVVVFLSSMLMQATSLAWLRAGKMHGAGLTRWTANETTPGDVIISNVYWFPELTATFAPTRRMLFSWRPGEIPQMAAQAASNGFRQFRIVTSAQLTGYESPAVLDVPGSVCRYVRGRTTVLAQLQVSEYACTQP